MHRLDESAAGVYVIAVTPFTENGLIDEASIDRVVEFYLEKGVSGVTILGMMGESHKLSMEESRTVMTRYLRRVDGRVPVVVGVSNPGTDPLVSFANEAMAEGAAGVMVAPVGTLKTDEQIFAYFSGVLDRLGDTPVVLQDYPLVTGVNISVDTLVRLFERYSSIKMLKHEDWPGHTKAVAAARGAWTASQRPRGQWRSLFAAGTRARRQWSNDGLRVSRNAGRCLRGVPEG